LEARINKYKNKRSWLQDLELWLSGMSTSNYGLTCNGGELLTVWPYRTTVNEQAIPGYHGLGLQAVETVIVYPQI
jgi:P2-related tail formation protein